jgi:hypothetical protein
MRNTDKEWQQFGEIDPYYGVLTHPRFRLAAGEGEARREFFESGEGHIQMLSGSISIRISLLRVRSTSAAALED